MYHPKSLPGQIVLNKIFPLGSKKYIFESFLAPEKRARSASTFYRLRARQAQPRHWHPRHLRRRHLRMLRSVALPAACHA